MKSELAFGDSNTWGLIPEQRKDILGKPDGQGFYKTSAYLSALLRKGYAEERPHSRMI